MIESINKLVFIGDKQKAEELKIDFISTKKEAKLLGYSHAILKTQKGLELEDILKKSGIKLRVDFLTGKLGHRLRKGDDKIPQIAKAVGFVHGKKLTLIDATAGFGTDGFVLAKVGCHVTMIEKVSWIYEMLFDGIQRAAENEILKEAVNRITLMNNDAIVYLNSQIALNQKTDVVYLDPMFPPDKNTARPKKEMQVLQLLLKNTEIPNQNQQTNEELLLKLAILCAKKRVVVKRNLKSPRFANAKPQLEIKGKTTRYDVFFT